MSTRSVLLAVLAVILASTACQPPAQQAAGLSEEDVAAIRNVLDSIIEADLASDWAAAAALETEDFVYMPANQPMIEGRAAWLAWIESLNMTITDIEITRTEIDGRGDLGYLWGTYSETLTLEGVTEPIEEVGKFAWILRKQPDGSWLLFLSISNSNLPLPEEGAESET